MPIKSVFRIPSTNRLVSSDFIPKSQYDSGYLIANGFFDESEPSTYNLGYTTIGSVPLSGVTDSATLGSRFTASQSGNVTSIKVYTNIGASGTATLRVAIFANTGSDTIGSLIASSSPVNVTNTSPAWIDVPISASVTGGNDYWLFAWGDASGFSSDFTYYADGNSDPNSIVTSFGNSYPDWSTVGDGVDENYDQGNLSIYAVVEVASADTNVETGLGQITFNGLSPTVSVTNNQNIQTQLGQVTYTGYSPTIQTDRNIQTGLGQVTYIGYSPDVQTNINIRPQLGQVLFNGFEPNVSVTIGITTGLGQVVYTGYSPSIQNDVNIRTGLGQLVFNGFAPSIQNDNRITTQLGQVNYTGYSPYVATDNRIVTLTGQLVFTGYSPIVGLTGRVQTGLGEINYTGYSPNIENNVNLQTGLGQLLFTGYVPHITIVPPRRRLIIVS
jgi:hypothetical protein